MSKYIWIQQNYNYQECHLQAQTLYVNAYTKVDEDWRKFVHEQKETDLVTIISEEKLKKEETDKFINNSFRDGVLKTTGTDIDKIIPPVSRFDGGKRAAKKQSVIDKLMEFFEKNFGWMQSLIYQYIQN